jgi:RNA polymerase sigma-70 factor, ECF subfamily
MQSMDDTFLIKQTLAGNQNAFKFLVLRYQRPVFKFLGTFRLSQSVVEEIAQESFVRAYRSLATYDPAKGASFSSWLFTIARNLALSERERSHRQSKAIEAAMQLHPPLATDPRPDPQEQMEQEESKSKLLRAMALLPEPFRQALVLSYLRELSIAEIARIESCSAGTVKSRIFRGKQLLKTILIAEVKP